MGLLKSRNQVDNPLIFYLLSDNFLTIQRIMKENELIGLFHGLQGNRLLNFRLTNHTVSYTHLTLPTKA